MRHRGIRKGEIFLGSHDEGHDYDSDQTQNELVSPHQLVERLGISLRMVREMDYTNHYEQILELSGPRPTTLVRKPD